MRRRAYSKKCCALRPTTVRPGPTTSARSSSSERIRRPNNNSGTLLEREPDNWDYLVLGATIQAGLGQHERAITTYRRVLAVAPGWVHLYLLLGNSLKAVGRQQEAIDAYQAAATHRPGLGDAYWSLANLKTYRFSDEEIERMRALSAAATTSVVDRYHVCFALGKALEDRAQYADSWRCYELGNRLKSMQTPHDPRAIERQVDHLIETYGTDRFALTGGCFTPAQDTDFHRGATEVRLDTG